MADHLWRDLETAAAHAPIQPDGAAEVLLAGTGQAAATRRHYGAFSLKFEGWKLSVTPFWKQAVRNKMWEKVKKSAVNPFQVH